MINHYSYQPTPRDMMIAGKAMADLTATIVGNTPKIFLGAKVVYPPANGKAMSQKDAVAMHEALYGEKGTIAVKNKNEVLFKQVNGAVNQDKVNLAEKLAEKLAPKEEVREVKNEAREKYQELLDKHPSFQGFDQQTYEIRSGYEPFDQMQIDLAVSDMAIQEGLPFEEFIAVVTEGSTYVNTTMDANAGGEGPQIPEALEHLAQIGSDYQRKLNDLAAKSKVTEIIQPVVEPTIQESLVDSTVNDSVQVVEPVTEPVGEVPTIQELTDSVIDEIEPISESIADPLPEEAIEETVIETQTIQEISRDLTPDLRFDPPETEIAMLTAKIETLQTELASMKKTLDKIANKEPIPKIRSWARNGINNVINKIQDRAKIDLVKTVNFGKDLAQKGMDKIAEATNTLGEKMLKVDSIAVDLKSVFEIHNNETVVPVGDYTLKNEDGKMSVNHPERGEVFSVNGKGPVLSSNFNGDDYRMLSGINDAVNVIAGPAAIAAEVLKDLTVGAAKEEAQKSAIKL